MSRSIIATLNRWEGATTSRSPASPRSVRSPRWPGSSSASSAAPSDGASCVRATGPDDVVDWSDDLAGRRLGGPARPRRRGAVVARWIVLRVPLAGGSGIQHVEAVWRGEADFAPPRVVPAKFAGGVLALASGLLLGREGPTVQMGAVIGVETGRRCRLHDHDLRVLQAAVAGAGLAVAFNTPFGGAIFVFEEIAREFQARLVLVALASGPVAVVCSRLLVGNAFDLPVPQLPTPGALVIIVFAVFGLLTGLLAATYNHLIVGAIDLTQRFAVRRRWCWPGSSARGIGVLFFVQPLLVGEGTDLTRDVLAGQVAMWPLAGYLIARGLLGSAVVRGRDTRRPVLAAARDRGRVGCAVPRDRRRRAARRRGRRDGVRRRRHGRLLRRRRAGAADGGGPHLGDDGCHPPGDGDAGRQLRGDADRDEGPLGADLRHVADAACCSGSGDVVGRDTDPRCWVSDVRSTGGDDPSRRAGRRPRDVPVGERGDRAHDRRRHRHPDLGDGADALVRRGRHAHRSPRRDHRPARDADLRVAQPAVGPVVGRRHPSTRRRHDAPHGRRRGGVDRSRRGGRRAARAGVSRHGVRPRPRVRRLPHGHLGRQRVRRRVRRSRRAVHLPRRRAAPRLRFAPRAVDGRAPTTSPHGPPTSSTGSNGWTTACTSS